VEALKENLRSVPRRLMSALGGVFSGGFGYLGHLPGLLREGFKEARIGLRSPDRPTRRMSKVFYLSLAGVFVTCYAAGKFFVEQRARELQAEELAARARAEERARLLEIRRRSEPPPYQSLGTFSLEIRESEGLARSAGLRAAEMEIFVSCSEQEACDWIRTHLDLARGELGSLFTPTDRDKILSPGGKKAFREEIRDEINRVLEERGVKGMVIDVLFPRFIVS
jgi:flagellar basal body-associated protein FliL